MYGIENRSWISVSWNRGNSFGLGCLKRKAEKIVQRIKSESVEVVASVFAIGFGAFTIVRIVGIV